MEEVKVCSISQKQNYNEEKSKKNKFCIRFIFLAFPLNLLVTPQTTPTPTFVKPVLYNQHSVLTRH